MPRALTHSDPPTKEPAQRTKTTLNIQTVFGFPKLVSPLTSSGSMETFKPQILDINSRKRWEHRLHQLLDGESMKTSDLRTDFFRHRLSSQPTKSGKSQKSLPKWKKFLLDIQMERKGWLVNDKVCFHPRTHTRPYRDGQDDVSAGLEGNMKLTYAQTHTHGETLSGK